MSENLEQRYSDGFVIREEGGATIVSGLCVPFYDGTRQTEYELEPGYFERVSQNLVFNVTDVEANIMHDRKRLIGMTPNTLRLKKTTRGIEYEIVLDDSTDSRDARTMVRNGKLRGASIGFRPEKTSIDGNNITLRSIVLDHIALVSRPAYKSTTAYLRSITESKDRELMAIYEQRLIQALAD